MKRSLKNLLEKGIVVFDGAVGTELYKRGQFVNVCFDELCLGRPDLVVEIHTSYRRAGADVLTTNSFGTNRYKLADYLLADRTAEIARAAASLARSVAGEELLVAGSVGPLGRQASLNSLSREEAAEAFREAMVGLMEGGADFILLETFGRRRELEIAISTVVELGFPYLPCMAFGDIPSSLGGDSIEDFFSPTAGLGGNAAPLMLGFNCSVGPKTMLDFLGPFLRSCSLPVLARPNAGAPQRLNDRMLYMTSPEYFTNYAQRFVELGVRAVGGCCGTGPEHIQEASRTLRAANKVSLSMGGRSSSPGAVADEGRPALPAEALPLAERSRLGAKLDRGEWITSVELVPPLGYDLDTTLGRARRCAEAGVNCINVPDGPRASSRVSPMITALRIQQEVGIEAVLHVTCRDRNLIGVQSDLLGCAAAGIHNLLIITGDPPKLGDYPNATPVFDLDSIGLTRLAHRLNGGLDLGDKPIAPATRFTLGVGADPTNLDLEREIDRLYQKAAAGAEYAITQPVYDAEALLRYIERIKASGLRIIAGIWPLASYNNALFLNNEVPGVSIPESVMERMRGAGDKEHARRVGIEIARGMLEILRPHIGGVQVSAPFGNVETALAVLA